MGSSSLPEQLTIESDPCAARAAMTFCLNPDCSQPQNAADAIACRTCGLPLLLRGRYRPIKAIGEGGFGRTYLAVDGDRLNARCAIKQLLPQQLAGTHLKQSTLDKIRELFEEEAKRLFQLGIHPQIPTLLAFFEERGCLYLVQEYIDGETLWDELEREGAFDEQRVRQVLVQLLPVLKFLHQRHVIHRDITPVNILRRHRDGKLVLIDFGVAKQLTRTSLAQPGTKVGTTGYAPLEQLRSGKAYPASDIYSLGVTCIHLLTNVRPDNLFDPVRGWLWRERLARQGMQVSDRLVTLLEKMTRDMVGDRYQSVNEIVRDVKSLPPQRTTLPPKSTIAPKPSSVRLITPPPRDATNNAKTVVEPGESSSIPEWFTPKPASAPPHVKSPGWRCIHTLTGHSSWVTSVAVSPNGRLAASGSLDDKIRVWKLQTGKLLGILADHSKSVNSVAISPDGRTIASCGDDGKVKLWNLETGQLATTLGEHFRDVNSVVFSPNGAILASGSEDRTIKIWNLADYSLLTTLSDASGIIKSLDFSPDGTILASGGLDNSIRLWNVSRRDTELVLSGHTNSVTCVGISPDGKILASASKDKTIKLWNLQTGELIDTLSSHIADVNAVVFGRNGQWLISGSTDKKIKIWNCDRRQVMETLSGHSGAVNSIAIDPEGTTIVSGSWDKTVMVWRWFP